MTIQLFSMIIKIIDITSVIDIDHVNNDNCGRGGTK